MFKKIILINLLIFLIGCSDSGVKTDKISAAVTIPPYEYLVKKIGGDKVDVLTSVPVGATPHQFDPKPNLIQTISKVDYYFVVGKYIGFENTWVDKLTAINDEMKVVDLSEGIEYIDNDPHVWLSPKRIKIIAENIYNRLSEISVENKIVFRKNYEALIDSVNLIEAELKSSFEKLNNKTLLVYHGSWTYLADDFGLKQISIEQGSKSASAMEFKEILNEVRKTNVPVIFIDPQHSKTSAEVVANDLNITLEVIDPLSPNLLNNFIKVKNKIMKYYK